VISKDSAEHYTWGDGCDGWYLVSQPGLSVIHERMPPGTAEVRHYHERARQLFFVLAGTATLEVAGVRETLGPQQALEVSPGVPHQMFNESDGDIDFLVISQPTTRGDRTNVAASCIYSRLSSSY
jgi:mannose-6-phosphate isomerase-like protein (cupin superfamily)